MKRSAPPDVLAAPGPGEPREPRTLPVILLCLLLATLITLGDHARRHWADSLLPVLISTQHWTPFWWQTNRYGQLISLVAVPFEAPFANLLVQNLLHVFLGLCCQVLLVRYVCRERTWRVAAVGSLLMFLLAWPRGLRHVAFMQCYAPSLALGFGGLLVLEATGRGGRSVLRALQILSGVLLLILAHWVNFGAIVALLPVALLRHAADAAPSLREKAGTLREVGRIPGGALRLIATVAAVAGPFLVVFAWMNGQPYAFTRTTLAPPSAWFSRWWEVGHTLLWRTSRVLPLLCVPAAAGLLTLLVRRKRESPLRALVPVVVLLLSAGCYSFAIGFLDHVTPTEVRYQIPTLLMVHVGLCLLAALPLASALDRRGRVFGAVLALAVPLAAVDTYGRPSFEGVIQILDEKFGGHTEEILAARVTHVAGAYKSAYPAVFHANMVLSRRGERRQLWAISTQSQPTQHLWGWPPNKPPRDLCIAVPIGEKEWIREVERITHTQFRVEQGSTVFLLRPASPS